MLRLEQGYTVRYTHKYGFKDVCVFYRRPTDPLITHHYCICLIMVWTLVVDGLFSWTQTPTEPWSRVLVNTHSNTHQLGFIFKCKCIAMCTTTTLGFNNRQNDSIPPKLPYWLSQCGFFGLSWCATKLNIVIERFTNKPLPNVNLVHLSSRKNFSVWTLHHHITK